MAKKNRNPFQPTTLEALLQGWPGEYMDVAVDQQPESDRAAMVAVARRWVSNRRLLPEERERIQAVWLDGEYRAAMNVDRARREELRALILPRHDREEVTA